MLRFKLGAYKEYATNPIRISDDLKTLLVLSDEILPDVTGIKKCGLNAIAFRVYEIEVALHQPVLFQPSELVILNGNKPEILFALDVLGLKRLPDEKFDRRLYDSKGKTLRDWDRGLVNIKINTAHPDVTFETCKNGWYFTSNTDVDHYACGFGDEQPAGIDFNTCKVIDLLHLYKLNLPIAEHIIDSFIDLTI